MISQVTAGNFLQGTTADKIVLWSAPGPMARIRLVLGNEDTATCSLILLNSPLICLMCLARFAGLLSYTPMQDRFPYVIAISALKLLPWHVFWT